MYIIGLDIGGTKCAATISKVTKKKIEILDKYKFSSSDKTSDQILEEFSKFVEKYRNIYQIEAIGIPCGSPLDSKKGIIINPPNLPKFKNVEIVKYFEEKFNIPTFLENDANACALAEYYYGSGIGCKDYAFITFGTGFGAGLILDGKLYRGICDNAGEIGHIRLTNSGPIGYYKKGSCEGYCSGGGIKQIAQIMIKKELKKGNTPKMLEDIKDINLLDAKVISEYARSGDKLALDIFKLSGKMLGRSLAILIDLLNLERIALAGVYMRSHDLLDKSMYKELKKECLMLSLNNVEIVPAKLGEEIGDYSAVCVALNGLKEGKK